MTLVYIMYGAIRSAFTDHFVSSLNVYIQPAFIGLFSFHFGLAVVLFNDENTLLNIVSWPILKIQVFVKCL